MNKLIAIVGMPGSGKGVVTDFFVDRGYTKVYFGGITLDIIAERQLPPGEESERLVRTELREKHGLAAYAVVSLTKIEQALEDGNVVIDGLYSWEEYEVLKQKFPEMVVVACHASPETRYARLEQRPNRPLTREEAASRDRDQLVSMHTGGPIAMADIHIVNEGTRAAFQEVLESHFD